MRILMLGNSLTTHNDLPGMVAQNTGAEVVVHARGGARLAEQLNPDTQMGAKTLATLKDEQWDFVVLQEMSHGPATSSEAYLRSVAGLCQLIKANGAKPVIFATWAYNTGCPKYEDLGMTDVEMHTRMCDAFERAAEENDAVLADVCNLFFRHPFKGMLFDADGVHPGPAGSAFASQCISTVIKEAAGI